MNHNINLKELWNRQEVPIPKIDKLLKKANHLKRRNFFKFTFACIALISASIFMIKFWFDGFPKLIYTKVGIVLFVFGMLLLAASYISIFPLIVKRTLTSSEYLQHLIKLKKKQLFIKTKMVNYYMLFVSAGTFLFIYEFVYKSTIFYIILYYTLTFFWMAGFWYYSYFHETKKEQKKYKILIDKFKVLEKRLRDKELDN
jgi:hypothetical protein